MGGRHNFSRRTYPRPLADRGPPSLPLIIDHHALECGRPIVRARGTFLRTELSTWCVPNSRGLDSKLHPGRRPCMGDTQVKLSLPPGGV